MQLIIWFNVRTFYDVILFVVKVRLLRCCVSNVNKSHTLDEKVNVEQHMHSFFLRSNICIPND